MTNANNTTSLNTYEIRHVDGANYGTVDAESPEAAVAQLGLDMNDVHVTDWGPADDEDYI